MTEFLTKIDFWIVFGFVAQGIFFLRFIVQWLYSEYHKKSAIPIAFWYISLVGAVAIAIYAWHIKDPVFLIGQSIALLIYARNIVLVRREKKQSDKID